MIYSMIFCIHVTWFHYTARLYLSKIAHSISLPVFIMWAKPVFCFNETCCSSEQNVACLCESTNPESRWKHITAGGNKHTHLCSVYRRINDKGHKFNPPGQRELEVCCNNPSTNTHTRTHLVPKWNVIVSPCVCCWMAWQSAIPSLWSRGGCCIVCHTIVIRRATETEGKRVNLIVCYTMAF